jgi:hypothetical protein
VAESLPPEDPRDSLIAGQAGQITALTALAAELREQLDAALRGRHRADDRCGNCLTSPQLGAER